MKRTADSRLTPLLNITGEGVRRAREEAGYTQKQLSIKLETKAVYICRGSLSRAEHGSRIVADLALQAVSEVLNDPMERLRLSKKPDWPLVIAREQRSAARSPTGRGLRTAVALSGLSSSSVLRTLKLVRGESAAA